MPSEYKHHLGSIHAYLEQLLKTATKGNVTVEYALHVSRMRLACKVCDMQLTTREPEGTELDYAVQEFVKIHAHVGGHKDAPVGHVVGQGGKCWCGEIHADYVKPVTLDFKPAGGFHPLPSNAKAILADIKSGSAMIDEKYKNAQTIQNQMEAYEKELAEKMSDVALANKIKILQMGDKEKAAELQKIAQAVIDKQMASSGNVEQSKSELIALQNILLIKQMQQKKQQLLGQISGQHAPPPPPPKAKLLKIATGRKFR